jgi:hypothetical protein
MSMFVFLVLTPFYTASQPRRTMSSFTYESTRNRNLEEQFRRLPTSLHGVTIQKNNFVVYLRVYTASQPTAITLVIFTAVCLPVQHSCWNHMQAEFLSSRAFSALPIWSSTTHATISDVNVRSEEMVDILNLACTTVLYFLKANIANFVKHSPSWEENSLSVSAFYGTQRVIIVFTTSRHWTVSSAR